MRPDRGLDAFFSAAGLAFSVAFGVGFGVAFGVAGRAFSAAFGAVFLAASGAAVPDPVFRSVAVEGAPAPSRLSRCPGMMRSGSLPTTVRLAAYSCCQPPRTRSADAIPESESPRATVYDSRAPGTAVGDAFTVALSRAVLAEGPDFEALSFPPSTATWRFDCGAMSGASPPCFRPARTEHVGQAPGPCPSSTFSATAICWSLVARSARAA